MATLIPTPALDVLLDLALAEDVGCGDVTTEAVIPPETVGNARVVARAPLVFCGAPAGDRLLWRYGPIAPAVTWQVSEGASVDRGTVVAVLDGRLRDLLVIERTHRQAGRNVPEPRAGLFFRVPRRTFDHS